MKKEEYVPFYDPFFRDSQTPSENRLTAILKKSRVRPRFQTRLARTECLYSTNFITIKIRGTQRCSLPLNSWEFVASAALRQHLISTTWGKFSFPSNDFYFPPEIHLL